MKIILIPGSFNPITNAHIDMAKEAMKVVNADKAIFIPAHDTYVARKKVLIPGFCRVQLINKAVSYTDKIYAIDYETMSMYPSKTYNTVEALKEENPNDEYYICLGMDNIKSLTSWYNWKEFVSKNKFIACDRNGQSLNDIFSIWNLLSNYKDNFIEVHLPKNNISSSLVRDLCNMNEFDKVKKIVPNNVYEYLIKFYESLK